jgi:ketosteroid isomerase-like protein
MRIKTPAMGTSDSQAQVIAFIDAVYAGEVERALACCDDDVTSMVHLPVELFPHLAQRRGKQTIAGLVEAHAARYSKARYEISFLVADRLRVAVILMLSLTKRADGRVIRLSAGSFFTLRRGLIVGVQSFSDTMDMVEQLTGRDLAGSLLGELGPALRLPPLPPPASIKPVK